MSESGHTAVRFPPAALLLAGAIIAAFVLTGQFNPESAQSQYYRNQFGVTPGEFSVSDPHSIETLFTHVFVHYGFGHLLMNMFAYLQAAPFVAQRLGAAKFLLLFFASGVGGAAAFILINPGAEVAAVGASGAICGLFGAFFLSVRPSPRAALADPQIRNMIFVFLGVNVVLMGVLAVLHILPIAWEAHLGGFVAGALAYLALAPRHRAGPWG